MLPHLLRVTILLTTIYLQDPIHSNQSLSQLTSLVNYLKGIRKRRLQAYSNKMDFMYTKQCHFDDIKA